MIKNFFKMAFLEFKRLLRNKAVIILLVSFPVILLSIITFVQNSGTNDVFDIGYCVSGTQDSEEVIDVLKEKFNKSTFSKEDDKDIGLSKLNCGDYSFFIEIIATEDPVKATFFYDPSTSVGNAISTSISAFNDSFAVNEIMTYSQAIGITLNREYFNIVNVEAINPQKDMIVYRETYVMEVVCFLSLAVILGLAFSISRDNETNVSKRLSYSPISISKYLLSKMLAYAVMGLFIYTLLVLIGIFFCKIHFVGNILTILLIGVLYLTTVCSLGGLLCMQKSQIATAFLAMIVVLLPILSLSQNMLESFPPLVQFFVLCFPPSAFIKLLSYIMFNGIIIWKYVAILGIQTLLFYVITILLMKRKVIKGQ